MSLVKLESGASQVKTSSDNAVSQSDSASSDVTSAIGSASLGALDMLIPGYSTFAQYIATKLGLDVTSIVRLAGLVYAIEKLYHIIIHGPLMGFLNEHFYSTVRISYTEDIFDSLLSWYYDVIAKRNTRCQRINTAWDDDEDEEDRVNSAIDSSNLTIFGLPSTQTRMFDYSSWKADLPPPYQPDAGVYSFWYKRRYFTMNRARGSMNGFDSYSSSSREYVLLSCFGRTIDPIKSLLQDVIRYTIEKKAAFTRVHTSADTDNDCYWENSGLKPTRPLSTVILDDHQKQSLVDDINSFLHPLSQKWYRSRAIPYRRGYLFHGPPGTGKTSLSLALAGIFRFDLYTLSLNDPKMTETGLAELFRLLPRRCIVLLEDIDDAGLKRSSKEFQRQKKKSKDNDDGSPPGISLSGLLNVIDGVGSQEGRILIMTSNYPEHLDPAMLRSGRVDMKVEFTYARKAQIKALYMRMYEITEQTGMIVGGETADAFFDSANASFGPLWSSEDPSARGEKFQRELPADPVERAKVRCAMINARLLELAEQFAEKIPDGKIAPSDLQGYLLRYKTQPRQAFEEVHDFIETTLGAYERAREDKAREAREADERIKLEEAEEESARLEREQRTKALGVFADTSGSSVPSTPIPVTAAESVAPSPSPALPVAVTDTATSATSSSKMPKLAVGTQSTVPAPSEVGSRSTDSDAGSDSRSAATEATEVSETDKMPNLAKGTTAYNDATTATATSIVEQAA